MDPGQWARIDSALQQLLDGEPIDSLSFSAQERDLLDRLLKSARGETPGLDTPPWSDPALVSGLSAALTDHDDIVVGSIVGAFRVLEKIGAGGMGVVFLAERAEGGFDQRVALKLLAHGTGDPGAIRLFERERRLLSKLEHPGIARLVDGGLTDDGRPWFAMEYIEGESIEQFANTRQLGIAHRIKLFLQACDALDYAHRQLILHRDIKPTNLLVDNSGAVRLVDFGLGRIFDPDQVSDANTTLAAGRMTPGYASPEQARGEPVTIASEVYQLGLVLHLLLTGELPYRMDGRNAFEIATKISETTIRPPSERWRAPGAAERAERMTGHGVESLQRRLRGDLDNIVLTALARQPDKRYASAAALSEDLRRHLARIPVKARAATRSYRLARFVQRNGLAVAASVALVAVLAGSAILLGLQARDLATERDRATTEAGRARLEAAKSRQVSDFLVELFRAADPAAAMGRQTPVGELLDRGQQEIEALEDQPAVQAELLRTMADVNTALGEFDRAAALLEQALTAIERVPDAPAAQRAQIVLAQARNLFDRGDYEPAEATVGAMIGATADLPAALVERAMTLKADIQQATGRLDEARDTLLKLVDERKADAAPDELDAEIARSLAIVYARQSRMVLAIEQFRQALEIRRTLHGNEHPETTGALGNLGTALLMAGRIEEGRQVVAQTLEIEQRILGPDHPGLADWLQSLGSASAELGELEAAADYHERGLAIREASLGEDHPDTLSSRYSLALALAGLGRENEALEALGRVLDKRRESLGETHPGVANALHAIGVIECRQRRFDECKRSLESALNMRRAMFGDDHMHVADSYLALARLAHDQGDSARARELLTRADHIARNNLDSEHPFFTRLAELAGDFDES